jgi:predicted nucleic acid-binding protein
MSVMSKSLVCVDASLVLKLVLPEDHSDRAQRLWKNWLVDGIQPISPRLLFYEVTSVLCKHAHRPTAYDGHYLALAEHMNCPFWTADERLFNVVHDKLDRVCWLGHQSS